MRQIKYLLIISLISLAGCGLNKNSVQVNKEVKEARKVENKSLGEDYEIRNENEDEDEDLPSPLASLGATAGKDENEEIAREEIKIKLPASFDQEVAFAPQAPFGVWDELHEEACEEAAMIIAAKHLQGEKLDKDIMEAEIKKLVEWEKNNLDKWKDTTAEETARIIKDYFHLSAELLHQPEVEDLKREVTSGKLVIVPTAGRLLDNPYFSGQGPLYHMLVIRGYDQKYFITNDPGTKRGEGFKYTYVNLLGSIHDWNNGEVRKGERVVIVVGK